MKTKSAPIFNRHHFARNSAARRKRQAAAWDVNDVSRDVAGTHPSRRESVRWVGVVEFRASKLSPRRSKEALGASWKPRRQAAVLRALERLRCAASSRRLQVHSGSTLRLPSQKMRCGLFQTNLAALRSADSSGLINLLVVRIAISVQAAIQRLQIRARRGLAPRCLDQNVSRYIQRPSATYDRREKLDI
jgi:hypothetical protein